MRNRLSRDITSNVVELIAQKRAKTFLGVLLLLYALALAVQTLLPSYLDYKSSESLSFAVNDGWCTPALQGIGAHCFGDFYYALHFANSNMPWSTTPNPNPPLGIALFKPFAFLVSLKPTSHLPLVIYLLTCLVTVLIPAVHSYVSKRLKSLHAAAIAALSIASAPVLMSFDRGNPQLLLIPVIYFFCLSVLEKRTSKILIFGVLLILIKPQMIVLGAIFLVERQWRVLSKWGIAGIITFLLSFLLYPRHLLANVEAYFHQTMNYQKYAAPGALAPVNLSIANLWSWLQNNSVFDAAQNTKVPGTYYPLIVTVLISAFVCLNLVFVGRARNPISNLLIVFCLPILLPSTTFAYYLCILVPIFTLILADSFSRNEFNHSFLKFKDGGEHPPLYMIFQDRVGAVLISLTLYLLFIPWALPWSVFSRFNHESWSSIGINWIVGQFFLTALFISLLLTGVRARLFTNQTAKNGVTQNSHEG